MAFIIAEPCIDVMDRACVEVCPVDCIYEPDATNLPEEDTPEEWKEYIEINAKAFT